MFVCFLKILIMFVILVNKRGVYVINIKKEVSMLLWPIELDHDDPTTGTRKSVT